MAGSAEGTGLGVKAVDKRKWLVWLARAIPPVLLIGFIWLNTGPVRIRFLLWEVHTSLIWALITAAGLGFLIGYFSHRLRK